MWLTTAPVSKFELAAASACGFAEPHFDLRDSVPERFHDLSDFCLVIDIGLAIGEIAYKAYRLKRLVRPLFGQLAELRVLFLISGHAFCLDVRDVRNKFALYMRYRQYNLRIFRKYVQNYRILSAKARMDST